MNKVIELKEKRKRLEADYERLIGSEANAKAAITECIKEVDRELEKYEVEFVLKGSCDEFVKHLCSSIHYWCWKGTRNMNAEEEAAGFINKFFSKRHKKKVLMKGFELWQNTVLELNDKKTEEDIKPACELRRYVRVSGIGKNGEILVEHSDNPASGFKSRIDSSDSINVNSRIKENCYNNVWHDLADSTCYAHMIDDIGSPLFAGDKQVKDEEELVLRCGNSTYWSFNHGSNKGFKIERSGNHYCLDDECRLCLIRSDYIEITFLNCHLSWFEDLLKESTFKLKLECNGKTIIESKVALVSCLGADCDNKKSACTLKFRVVKNKEV